MANKNRFWCSPTAEMQEAFIRKYGTKINNEYVLSLIAKDLEVDAKNVSINHDLIMQFIKDNKQEFCCRSICEALGYNGRNRQQKVAKYLSLLEKVETKSNQKIYKQTSVTMTEESYNFIKEYVKNYSYFATTCEAILLTVLKNKEVINNA